MLRSRGVQTLVNGAIIVTIIALLIAAPLIIIRPKSAGVLVGKMASSDGLISGVLSGMDPKKVAAMMNGSTEELAEFASKMIGELDPENIANAVNENGEWISQLIGDLDGAALAEGMGPMMEGSMDFINELLVEIDPKVIADAINNNQDFLVDFIGEMDPSMMSPMLEIEGIAEFANKLLPLMDAKVIAGILNGNETFITQLIGAINPDALMGVMTPETMKSMTGIVAYLDPAPLAAIANELGPFLNNIVGKLDPAVLAGVVAGMDPSAMVKMVNAMDPGMIASILNGSSTATFVKGLAVNISPELINTVAGNQAMMAKMMAIMDPAAIGALVGQIGGFAVTLMNGLDPNVIAGLVEGNVGLITKMTDSIDFSLVNQLLENDQLFANAISMITNAMDFIDIGSIVGALGNVSSLMSGLMAELDPAVIAGMVNGNVEWIQQMATALSPAVLAETVGAVSPFLTNLLGKIDPAALGPIISGMDPNMLVDIMNKMLPLINTSVIANAVNANVPFLAGIIKNLNTSVLANAINANPEMISKLLPALDLQVLAEVVNSAGPMISDLMGRLNPQVIANLANGVVRDGGPFITGLLNAIDLNVINSALNNNGAFIEGVLANMNLSPAMMSGLDSDALAQLVEKMLGPGGVDPFAVADLVNNPAVIDFIGQLAGQLDPQLVANAVNSNTDFITDIMRYMEISGVMGVINASGAYIVDIANTLLPLLDAAALGQAISAADPSALAGLVDGLLAPPGPGGGIDINPIFDLLEDPALAVFVEELVATLDASGLSPMLTNTGNLVSNMMTWNEGSGPGLDPAVLVEAINGPNAPGGPVSPGINPRTGAPWQPVDNILKNVWIGASASIVIPGWDILGMEFPAITIYMQITGAQIAPAAFDLTGVGE